MGTATRQRFGVGVVRKFIYAIGGENGAQNAFYSTSREAWSPIG